MNGRFAVLAGVASAIVTVTGLAQGSWSWNNEGNPVTNKCTGYSMGASWVVANTADSIQTCEAGPSGNLYQNSSGWTEQTTSNWFSASTDLNGLPWAISDEQTNCFGSGGYTYYLTESGGTWAATALNTSRCLVAVAAGNACINGGGPSGCNNSNIWALDILGTLFQWNPLNSTWVQLATKPGSNNLIHLGVSQYTTSCGGTNLWGADGSGNVYHWSIGRNAMGQCNSTAAWYTATLPSGCTGSNKAVSVSNDTLLCTNDVYQYTSTGWSALGAGGCPNSGTHDSSQLGADPINGIWCWSEGDQVNYFALYYKIILLSRPQGDMASPRAARWVVAGR